jgi:hypothetical protein
MRAIVTFEETKTGYSFTIAKDGAICVSGEAESFTQAWDYCNVWAMAEIEYVLNTQSDVLLP